MPFFQGASNVTIHGGQFQDIKGDAYSYVDATKNIDSFNTSETLIRDSYNNNDGYGYGNPPGRPRRNNTSGHAPTASIPPRDRGTRPQYRDEYDDGGHDQYPPNPPYPPHRSYTSPQPPRQQPRYPPRQNPNERWQAADHDYGPESMDTSSDWTPRPQNQYRSDTFDFDSAFGGDAYSQSQPPRAPQRGPARQVQQPFYNGEPASEPALGANVRTASKNPFAQFRNADSQSSLVRRMDGLAVAEPFPQQRSVAFAPEPQFVPPPQQDLLMMSGSSMYTNDRRMGNSPSPGPAQGNSMISGGSMYTEDRPRMGLSPSPRMGPSPSPRMGPSPSPRPEPGYLDDRTASAIAYSIVSVISDKTSYRQLLHINREKAQRLVDIAQAVLESPRLDSMSRRELVVSMQRFSKSATVCPRSYKLEGVRKMGKGSTGEGAFGTVYRGVYQGRNVCLKALKEDGRTTHAQLAKAVAREAILWRQLDHRNILPFYGICELDVGLCMVSPWMRQGDLREYIKGPVSPDERLLIARDVAEGLKYLHSYDIVHGDLKGKNVLIDAVGRARIADFGLTSINDPDIAYWTSQSRAASRGGTAAFQAPEILTAPDDADDKNSMASDMYAWGCVCYELYVGEEPYKGSRDNVILQKLRSELPKRPDDNHLAWRRHGLTEKMWSLMDKSWSVQPDLRPDASEAVQKLSEMVDDDHRPQEEDEEEPEARFIARWCRAPTGDDMTPSGMRQKFRIPTIAEVEELLKLS